MKTSRTQIHTRTANRSLHAATRHTVTRRLAAVLLLFATLITGLPAMAEESGGQDSAHPGVVNINKADAAQLKQLPRVGPALADRILAFRESNGKFESTEDLILVQGIGEKTFEMLRTFVVVEGETTLTRKLKTSDVPTSDDASSD